MLYKIKDLKLIELIGHALDEYFGYFPYLNHEKIAGECLRLKILPIKDTAVVLELQQFYAVTFIVTAVLNVFNEKCDTIYGHLKTLLFNQISQMVLQ